MTQCQEMSLGNIDVECFLSGSAASQGSGPVVVAAHPTDIYNAATVELLAAATNALVVCVNPLGTRKVEPPQRPSLELMVDRVEEVRHRLEIDRWIFWGMSGGGWLAQIYGQRHPGSLAGIVIESACLCFRERLADPECVLSPFFPAWREPLSAAGLLGEHSHDEPSPGTDMEWLAVDGIGEVWRQREGAALLVSPGPVAPEMRRGIPRLWEFDSKAWIRTVTIPALVLCGSADPVVPARHARAVHEAMHHSSYVEVAGAGHVPSVEKRPEVALGFQSLVASRES